MRAFHTFETLALHSKKLAVIGGMTLLLLLLNLASGEVKHWGEIDWVDVIGEGGSAIAVAVWMLLILGSRPTGRVSNLLSIGLAIMFFALLQDSLDEFIRIADHAMWDSWLESFAMPSGILVLTYGLYHWHQEQLIISRQLRNKERIIREHESIDQITQLAKADYLKRVLAHAIKDHQRSKRPLSLMIIDIKDFMAFNQTHGMREANLLLDAIAQQITLNIRQADLLCRYAGDRFALILPNTCQADAQKLGAEIILSVAHLHFKHSQSDDSLLQQVNIGTLQWHPGLKTAESFLLAANRVLNANKPDSANLRQLLGS